MGRSTGVIEALQALEAACSAAPTRTTVTSWRWQLRQRLLGLHAALMVDDFGAGRADGWLSARHGVVARERADGWLSARHGVVARERAALLGRLTRTAGEVLDGPDLAELAAETKALARDVHHHLQRQHDLVYDEVELELGGEQ